MMDGDYYYYVLDDRIVVHIGVQIQFFYSFPVYIERPYFAVSCHPLYDVSMGYEIHVV